MLDLHVAFRGLRAAPLVAAIAALSLMLGIGANAAMFSLVNTLLLRPLPVAEPDRLVTVSSPTAISMGFPAGLGWSSAMWERFRPHSTTFAGALAWSSQELDLAEGGEAQSIAGVFASGDFFQTLGVSAALGRTFTSMDDRQGGGPDGLVAVISHQFWQRRFGGAAGVIGSRLLIERVPFTIIGVTPPRFLGLEIGRAFDVILPLATEPQVRGLRSSLDKPNALFLIVMLRLKPAQSVDDANAALRAIQLQILNVRPQEIANLPQFLKDPLTVVPAATGTSGTEPGLVGLRQRYQRALLTIFAVVALVWLVACLNVANLALARATARQPEVSVMLALGASRWRVTRQVLVESLVLTGIGAAGGVMFALWGSQWLSAQLSTPADRITLDQSIDWRVIGFATLTTMVTAAIFGLVPAVRSTHVLPLDALRRQGQRVSGDARASISGALIITQVAVSLVLAFGAGLFTQTFARLAAVPLGFDRDRVLVFNVDTARADVGPADRFALYQRLVDIARARPGVAHAAASLWTPIGGGFGFFGVTVPSTSISGRAELNIVTPSWFATYGTAMRAGRDISDRDTAAQAPVVVVNEAFVRKFLPGRSAVGEIVERGSGRSTSTQSTIVGVVTDQLVQGGVKPDGTFRSLRGEAPPTVYVPLAQSAGLGPPGRTAIAISIAAVAGSARLLAPDLAAALAATDRNLSFTVKPLTDEVDAAIAQEGLVAWLSTFFGVLGVLLAGVGVYGVTAYAVTRRRSELGVRLALGAAPRQVVRHVLARTLFLVCTGVALGVMLSIAGAQVAAALTYGVDARDPLTIGAAALVVSGVGLLAGWMPARHAAGLDPATVLRDQ